MFFKMETVTTFKTTRLRNFSDDELLEVFELHPMEVFEEIYNRYWQKLYTTVYIRLKDKEAAQEIIQDFFTGLWMNRSKLHIHTSLSGYLFQSIKYAVLNYMRAEVVRMSYQELVLLAANDSSCSTEEYINHKELTEAISAGVNQLPPKCRSVFELSRNQYKTNKEIAGLLNISEKTVENHLTKALRYLRVNISLLIPFLLVLSLISDR